MAEAPHAELSGMTEGNPSMPNETQIVHCDGFARLLATMSAWSPPMWRRAAGAALGLGVASIDRLVAGLGDIRRTTAFVRGRVLFSPRSDDVYVATYPRSGTTWMQFMLHLWARGPTVEFRHINDVCPWFERSLAIGSVEPHQLEQLPSPRIFKTHLPPDWLPTTGRFVAIVRDPADVALSYFRLYRSYLGFDGSLDQFLRRFERGQVQYGSYWTHVDRWRQRAQRPGALLLRYEDLRAEPAEQLRRVAELLGWPDERARIEAVVEGASLERMKQLESRFDHATALLMERGVQSRHFIGAGIVGGGGQQLSAEQRARLEGAGDHSGRRHRVWRLPAFLH